ncbi:MAG: folate family ECF transporter S component [Peptoniphilus duerdenii]|uniref:folate family ECF transporter S component n=1 Tax=Peptoniphilus duerdenii TaxID=507750 RepID=UPI00254BA8F4|nr:folate family ECF transporter S component [Peptoniphilus duerdenii]MDK8276494.1 folate family ECF transporter S component [Peptoniphilus duerdenii]
MKTIASIFLYCLAVVLTMSVTTITIGAPKVYLGLVAAVIIVLFASRLLDKKYSLIASMASIAIGMALQVKMPMIPKMKPEKLEALKPLIETYHENLIKYGVIVVAIVGILVYVLSPKIKVARKQSSTRRITYMAVFIALSVVINTMRFGSVSFGGFPIIYSGLVLGPVNGLIVGAVSDVLGFIIRPSSGGYNVVFTLTSALTGLIPIMVVKLFKVKYPNYKFYQVLLGIFIGQMLTSVIMAPYFQALLFGKNTFYYYATKAFIKQAVSIPLYAALFTSMTESIKDSIDFEV